MYQDGDGMEADQAEAMRWLQGAAELGDDDAQRTLGFKYYNGDGVDKNLELAAKWLLKAAVCEELEEKDEIEGRDACFAIGAMYFKGEGVTKNEQEGAKWLKCACDDEVFAAKLVAEMYMTSLRES